MLAGNFTCLTMQDINLTIQCNRLAMQNIKLTI
jgi:hypothetical protein